ncbi:phospholipid scramblase 2 isoform X4 [Neodiprion pinetum]|uniref:Phospholipid scramblase n=1 Tax=Neodiprion lecontei TaxID=441921 RepID=A0ABM3FXF9_NEOLC|nr:uncharacterized protein LOC124179697 isoform X4 [Neodiprion fabricii]XP_046476552.1 uncharacterized protein LOC124216274 isoform X4 [Neodiprion pinetum]XP_046592705.1 uncharacterized protein LOC107226235 isoform X4 [Neodiprion lecontei]XP_046614152.1 uncharacterized protein LOC124302250 isoform X4 [Neodiprion virginianus]
MSQHNIGYVPDEIRPSAPPESAVYDEVSRDSRGNSTPVVPPVYMKQTIITVQPHNQNGTNRAQRVPVPVNTTEWVSTPRSQLNPLIGTDFLNGIEQLEIQQTVQLSTLLGETKSGNQYRVKVPRAETIFLATETSTECQRDILGSSRGFSLTLTDPTGQDAFKFTKSPGWGCVPGFLHIVSVDGTHQIASLIRQWDHILLDYTITLTVPAGTNVNLKGLLLGAAFLLEYLYFSRLKKS